MLAALNHSNIATIYGLEHSDGTHFLIMELVSGETLAERIKREGAVPVEEALKIAVQIAEALEAAHEKGIIHRDLKPANVKVTPEGKVKVLDFGLAKAFAGDVADSNPSQSPTLSAVATMQGVLLGTAAYMSPEQARGKVVDKRTDIWAFGVVLYEILTGKQAFEGEDVSLALAAVMKSEPEWSRLPKEISPALRNVLHRCLQKDPKQRLRDMGDVRLAMEGAFEAVVPREEPVGLPAAPKMPLWKELLPWATVAVVSVALGLTIWSLRPTPEPKPVARLAIPLSTSEHLAGTGEPMLALSQDSTQLTYVGGNQRQLYLRALDSMGTRSLAGTEGAISPFFSPDGQWIAFFASGKLKKVAVSGGVVLTLCDAPNSRGGAWSANDTIVFAPANNSGLTRISAAGGTPQALTKLKEGETTHRWPQFLPDGKTVLFTIATSPAFDDAMIATYRMDTGEQKVLIRGGTFPRYVPTGYLVYYRAGTIMATRFDAARLEVRGTPVPVLEGVLSSSGNTGAGQFDFSSLGSLVYVPGGAQAFADLTMVWVDRKGTEQPLPAPAHAYSNPRVSPDGRQVAVQIAENNTDIWIYELMRDTLTRLTYEGINSYPLWTPDGKRIVYRSTKTIKNIPFANLFWKPADGTGTEERLLTNPSSADTPTSLSPDGKILGYIESSKTGFDAMTLPLEGERKPQPFLATPFDQRGPWFSPDGHWAAYVSNESGHFEVYVQPFPGPGGKRPISIDGGAEVHWSSKGNELFYRSGDARETMMAVDIQTQPTFSAGKPHMLFQGAYASNLAADSTTPDYSLGADGRFLMLKTKEQQQTQPFAQINVVQNWFEELKRRVPTGK